MPGTVLNIENTTNFYLYGTETRPEILASEQYIRPTGTGPTVVVDGAQFMNVGGGRFAMGAAFEIIQLFFNDGALEEGIYSKEDLVTRYDLDNILLNIKQYEFIDGVDDYQERVYIYNQTAYMIGGGAEFYVSSDGSKEVRNYAITPYEQENFDFEGSNEVINFFQSILLEQKIDPSSIGHKFSIDFDLSGISRTTYTYEQFAFETVAWSLVHSAANIGGLLDMPSVVDDLYNAGTIDYLQDGLVVRWLTNGDDSDSDNGAGAAAASQLTLHTVLGETAMNGQIVMMGAGADEFFIDWGNLGASFQIHGGAGIDQVTVVDTLDSSWYAELDEVEFYNGSPYSDYVSVMSNGTNGVNVELGGGNDFIGVHNGVIDVVISAGEGDDSVILGEGGSAFVSGGDGTDVISFAGFSQGVTVTLTAATFVGDFILTNFEDIIGTDYADIISAQNASVSGLGGNDVINIVGGNADGGDGDDVIHVTEGGVDAGSGDDIVYATNDNGQMSGGDGDDVVNVTGHINPYSGYFDFEEVNATQENDLVNYTDGTKSVWTFSGDDTIIVTPNRISASAEGLYYIDGGDGLDRVTINSGKGYQLTIKDVEEVFDPVKGESIAWLAGAGAGDGDANRFVWALYQGYSLYYLSIEKIFNSDDYSVSYFFSEDVRLEADSPGYGFGFVVNDFQSGDLGLFI